MRHFRRVPPRALAPAPILCPRRGMAILRSTIHTKGGTKEPTIRGAAAKRKQDRLRARDNNGRFRTRGRNSVATVRGTRRSTRETCAGTLTRAMAGAVDVFDLRTHRTVRVRAGHTYPARTSG